MAISNGVPAMVCAHSGKWRPTFFGDPFGPSTLAPTCVLCIAGPSNPGPEILCFVWVHTIHGHAALQQIARGLHSARRLLRFVEWLQHGTDAKDGYATLSRDQLIDQIKLLTTHIEHQNNIKHLPSKCANKKAEKKRRRRKNLDFDRHPKCKIAMRSPYQGALHGGLAWLPEIKPLARVEGELFQVLRRAAGVTRPGRTVDAGEWGYSRAGQADAGMSGCRQVGSLWVRSCLKSVPDRFGFCSPTYPSGTGGTPDVSQTTTKECKEEEAMEKEEEEKLRSHTMLFNSILPDSVRIMSFLPIYEAFYARFLCTARGYICK
ncbi:hypothetical protein PCASD_16842 [Puccinia coronata f. sp. avenae]|uniref:Uncharacterized protein n=1 Tax=Puccinia coronata f. sp. avenae TaxID=200324 RepID=A0A2N5U4M3_9BASI|nr:hypothetical protein PCASD_16842 [Puccinia coronata f. sp. avenae]